MYNQENIAGENLISLDDICLHHHINTSFIQSLQKTGLIAVIIIDDAFYIESQQLPKLEQYIEFHYALDINLAGIETITHLLKQIQKLQNEANLLKNRLLFYESLE